MSEKTHRYKNDENCHCWIPVFGTLLIMISFIDLGFGVGYGAIIAEVASLKDQVNSSSTSLKFAGVFSSLTGGLINLGDSSLGNSAKEIVSNFHHVEFSANMAWLRIGVSGLGIPIGFLLAFRVKWSPLLTIFIGAASLILGFIGLTSSKEVYKFLMASGIEPLAVTIGALDVVLHVVWPVLLSMKLIVAKGKGLFPAW